MKELTLCPYCSCPISGERVMLWDDRTYCRKCVDEVSPELYGFATTGSRLEETVSPGDVRALRYVSFMGKWYLIAVMLIFGLPFGFLLLIGKMDIWGLLCVLVFFGGIGMAFLSLLSLVAISSVRSRLPRTVSVERGQLRITTPEEETSVRLSDCKWYLGSTAADPLYIFSGVRRGVVIQTPEVQIACGRDVQLRNHWRAFLTLTRIQQNPRGGCLRLVVIACLGMIVGLLVGLGIGLLVSMVTRNDAWTSALGLLGVIQGPVVAILYITSTSEKPVAARKRLHPALIGLIFFVIGMKSGAIVGVSGAFVCGTINGLFGGFVGAFCRARINAAEMERELTAESRR